MENNIGEPIPTSAGEGQKLAQTKFDVTPEQQAEKPNPLISKLAEVKIKAHIHSEKAIGLIEVKASESNLWEPLSTQDPFASREEIFGNIIVKPSGHLSKSKQALTPSAQTHEKAAAELQSLQDSLNRSNITVKNIDEKIRQLDQVKGLRRIPAALEEMRLVAQRPTYTQLVQLEEQIRTKRELVNQLTEQEESARLKQAELLIQEIGKEVKAIRVEYEKLSQDLLKDGSIAEEIRETYIELVIVPQVEKISEKKGYPDERKREFYSALKMCIDHRNDSKEQKQIYERNLHTLFNSETGFFDIQFVCDPLLRNDCELVLLNFFVNMAAKELQPIKDSADQHINGFRQWSNFSRVFNKTIRPAEDTEDTENIGQREDHTFRICLLRKLDKNFSDEPYEKMNLWNALKSSNTAKQFFGEDIRQRDLEMYTTAMDRALSDTRGDDINMLYHYPTPEAIRNLVILTAADEINFRTLHANETLNNLSKKPEWKQLLNKAVEAYPSLKATRETLENWSYTGKFNHPDIKRVAGDVALSLIEDENIDKRLRTLAMLSLQNDAIVNIIAKRGVVNEQEQSSLVQAITFLRTISEEALSQYVEGGSKTPYISDDFFTKGLRGNLFSLLQSKNGTVDPQILETIRRFDVVSKLVLENKSNLASLNHLINGFVIDRLKDSSIPITELPTFLNAYKTVPALLKKSNILSEYCKQYKDPNTVTFFRNITTAYGDLEEQLDSIVYLVGKGMIPQEKALQLPTVASDVLDSSSFHLAVENPKLFLETDENLDFFRKLTTEYRNQNTQLNQIVELIANQKITQERALELPALLGDDILYSRNFIIAVKYPKLFLETNDGVLFLQQVKRGNLFSLDQNLETNIGERIRTLQRSKDLRFSDLLARIVPGQLEQLDRVLSSGQTLEPGQLNWQQLLMGYVRSNSEVYGLPKLSQYSSEKLNSLFSDPKVRDACLNGLRDQWVGYLKSGKPEEMPFSLNLMSEFINYCGGAGPLSQINSLNTLINSVNYAFSRETTVERTKLEICQGLASMEDRFAREKWSNEDKTDFYNISRDIMGAAPSIFSDYLSLFGKLSPSQLREFASDIYPLYRTQLVLMEKKNKDGVTSFDKDQLMEMRRDIRNFGEVFGAGKEAFDEQKTKLLGEITGLFKERFGIIKIPESFTSEHVRSFTNISTYLSNLNARTSEKETILGFYLSMMVNNRWDDFRRGIEVNPDELLVPEKSDYIKRFLQERQRLNPLTAENLGLQPDEMPEFLKAIQQEASNVVVGDIETIDVKLTNIILNLKGLEDLDLYTNPLDKQRMGLLLDYGNKRIGSVVARMYQQLTNPAKEVQFNEDDKMIQIRISQIMQEHGLEITPQTLKEHFQDGIKPLSTVANLMSLINETKAEPEIQSLKSLLEPSAEVIEIFKRLGEDFKPTSGALALSQDLSYLDNLVVKRDDELKPEEISLIKGYISQIREQVVKLEGIYGQIKNKVGGLRQGNTQTTNPLLKEKLDQIDRIINAQVTQQAITSTATDNLNTIIENIRECLSCTKEGCNNDTDLTFGDLNKFYLYSQTETQIQGSISDELVFVEPITRSDGSQGMAFVFDRIYGTNTPTILENQIDAVLKKQRAIKQRFPEAKLSVFISDAAIQTGGTSVDMLLEKFRAKNILGKYESVEVNVIKSATGDHYIEFGGEARRAGKRQAHGVLLAV